MFAELTDSMHRISRCSHSMLKPADNCTVSLNGVHVEKWSCCQAHCHSTFIAHL